MDYDIVIGIYLINHLKPHCENCYTNDTPQWRKGWYSYILKKNVPLCNACGIKYNKSQYCKICHFIYDKKFSNGELFNICNLCKVWIHKKCDPKYYQDNYHCPQCRLAPIFFKF